jgi:hypothetical protein
LYWYNAKRPDVQARTDYAANVGDKFVFWSEGPPPDKAEKGEGFLVFNVGTEIIPPAKVTGVVMQRQPITTAQIRDGLAHTYFAGEKYVPYDKYESGTSPADDQSCWNGDDMDTVATTDYYPRRDGERELLDGVFGSAHADGLNMLHCDGSAHYISYQIDPDLHRQMGNRHDGKARPASQQ